MSSKMIDKDRQKALSECLARVEAGADVEASLVGWEEHATELRPMLEAALSVRKLTVEPHSERAFQAGKARMAAAVAAERDRPRRSWARFWPAQSLPRTASAVGVALVLALVALVGLTTDVLRSGTSTTQAEVEGFLTALHSNEMVLTTDDGLVTIQLSDDTRVLDTFGRLLPPSGIVPGGPLIVIVGSEDGVQTALKIELVEPVHGGQIVEVEFSGSVRSVTESSVTVDASFGLAFVKIVPETEMKGTIVAGSLVEVEGTNDGDGTFTASEIKVVGAGVVENGDDAGLTSGPSGGDDDDGGSGSGSHEDDDDGSNGGSDDDGDEGGSNNGSDRDDDDGDGSNSGSDGGDDDDGDGSDSGSGSGDDDDGDGSDSGAGSGDDDDSDGSDSGSSSGDDDDGDGSTGGSDGGSDDDDDGGSGSGDDDDDDGSSSGSGSDDDDDDDSSSSGSGSDDDDDGDGSRSSSGDGDGDGGDDGGSHSSSDDGGGDDGSSGDDDGDDGDDDGSNSSSVDDGSEPSGGNEDED